MSDPAMFAAALVLLCTFAAFALLTPRIERWIRKGGLS